MLINLFGQVGRYVKEVNKNDAVCIKAFFFVCGIKLAGKEVDKYILY